MWWTKQQPGNALRVRPALESLEERALLSVTPLSDNPAPLLSTNGHSYAQAVSADGNFVVIESSASDLVNGSDNNGTTDVFLLDRSKGVITLVSHAAGSPEAAANGKSENASISADGRFITYETEATNLQAGVVDKNGKRDIYVFDRLTGQNTLVSHAGKSTTITGDAGSYDAVISADGSRIAFQSNASNLVAGQADQNGSGDIFLYRRSSGENALVSHQAGAAQTTGDLASRFASISNDGSKVAFQSYATNLVTGQIDNNHALDVFLYDDSTGAVKLVSHLAGSPQTAAGAFELDFAPISGNGRFIAFSSDSTGLVPGASDQPNTVDLFLYDAQTQQVELVSRAAGQPGKLVAANGYSGFAAVSDSGRYVAYDSLATDLVAGQVDAAGTHDVFLYDRVTATTTLVSHAPGANNVGTGYLGFPNLPTISGDGRFVAYQSTADNLVKGQADANKADDVFLYDAYSGQNFLVSHTGDGVTAGNDESKNPRLSRDGSFIAVSSSASDLVSNDVNGKTDAFGYDNPDYGIIVVPSWPGGGIEAKPSGESAPVGRVRAVDALMSAPLLRAELGLPRVEVSPQPLTRLPEQPRTFSPDGATGYQARRKLSFGDMN